VIFSVCNNYYYIVSIGTTDSVANVALYECFYATADEADAYMFYRFFFFFCFFLFFSSVTKIPDNRSREQLNGFL